MKSLFLFFVSSICGRDIDGCDNHNERHVRLEIQAHCRHEKIYEKYPTIDDIISANEVVLNNVVIDKYFAYYIYIYPMSIQSFYSYIVNKYISNDGLKKCLLEKVYNLNPYELWEFLHNSEVFDESFINQVNAIYNYEDFILISHARMAIEYLVFGLNISLKSTLYEFSYIAQFKLKSLLHFIHEFLLKHSHLLYPANHSIINEMKKVIYSYASCKGDISIPIFLNEISKYEPIFRKLVNASNSNTAQSSYREKLAMCRRFSSIFGS